MPNQAWARNRNEERPWRVSHRPRAVLPATAQAPIFTVRNGPIRVIALIGRNTTACDATVTNLTIVANGSAGLTDVNLNTATAIASTPLGSLISPQAAAIGSAATIGGAVIGISAPPMVDTGTIDLLTSATNAGAFEWFLVWDAMHPQAQVSPVLPGGVAGFKSMVIPAPRELRRRATTLPATTQTAILRVKGGPIRLLALLGTVTSVFDATVTNLTVVANPDSGLTDVNLCTATAVASTALSSLLSLQASGIGSALVLGGGCAGLLNPPIIDVGTIDLLTNATNAGAVEWYALWEPLHPAGRLYIA